jgi:hypothetical protein
MKVAKRRSAPLTPFACVIALPEQRASLIKPGLRHLSNRVIVVQVTLLEGRHRG